MGIRQFHNIYSISKPSVPGNRWLLGFGFGVQTDIKQNMSLTIEALINQEFWFADATSGNFIHIDRLNLLNQVKVLFTYNPNDKIDLYIGPSFNVAVAETNPDLGTRPWHEIGPNWAFYNHTSDNTAQTNVKIWFGITGGVRL